MSPCLPPSDSPTLLHRVPYRIPYDPLVQTQRNGAMEGGRLGGTETRIIGDFDMEGEIFGRDDPVGGWGYTEERRHLGVCADRA